MAKVRVRPETRTLYLDFQYQTVRCREQTALADTPGNRRALEAVGKRIDRDIAKGSFDYRAYFPDSPRAEQFDDPADPTDAAASPTPTFAEFADVWYRESIPRWRDRYRRAIRETLDRIILPELGDKPLGAIQRADLLAFQAHIALRNGRGRQTISARRINKIMTLVKAVLNESADRFGLTSPARGLKTLKQRRPDVLPFSLEEAQLLIARVRTDYKYYLTIRLLTGLRTGEADGLQWQDVDLKNASFRIERTHSRDGDGDTKTQGSKRTIPMVPQVLAAFEAQARYRRPDCPWVFHTSNGHPIDAVNFTNRIWYPLLRNLDLRPRPPYQMRHTAATLMLASGENPEWIASVLGHSTTEMLFRVYSRYVPNLTRNDGQAFAGLVHSRITTSEPVSGGTQLATPVDSLLQALRALKPTEIAELLAKTTAKTYSEGTFDVD